MPNFCLQDCLYQNKRGRLFYTENGKEIGARAVFARGALVGVHLSLPRDLGATDVSLYLSADGEEEAACLPLRLRASCRGVDTYALLWEGETLSSPLYFFRIVADTLFGRLHGRATADGALHFSRKEGDAFPLLFTPAWRQDAAGGLYLLPLSRLERMGEGAYTGFFLYLASLGVGQIYLCPPAGEGARGNGQDPSACLPRAFAAAARENGVQLLGDLLLLCGAQEGGELLPALCPPLRGQAARDIPPVSFWEAPFLPEEDGGDLLRLTGEDGVISTALRAGYNGFVLRAADCFGDAFLSALRARLGDAEGACLLGATAAGGASLAFGTRRRFFFGGELDAPLSYNLRTALLAYFLLRDTEPLSYYLSVLLPTLPPAALHKQPNLLSSYEGDGFFATLAAPCGEARAETYTALAFLVAATLPGVPAYFAGEERSEKGEECGEAADARLAPLLRLAALRRKECVYRAGEFRLLHLSGTLLAFAREGEGESLITLVNMSEEPLSVSSPEGFSVVFGGRGRKNSFLLRPLTGAVLKIAHWAGESTRLRFENT